MSVLCLNVTFILRENRQHGEAPNEHQLLRSEWLVARQMSHTRPRYLIISLSLAAIKRRVHRLVPEPSC